MLRSDESWKENTNVLISTRSETELILMAGTVNDI